MKKIVCKRVFHGGENRVSMRFPYDSSLIRITRSIEGARWSRSMYSRHIPGNEKIIERLAGLFDGKAILDLSAIMPVLPVESRVHEAEDIKGKDLGAEIVSDKAFPLLSDKSKADIERFRKWLEVNRYPESTVRTYTGMMSTFLKFVSPKEAEECNSEDLIRIVDEYILPNGLSYSFQNQMASAVKKFYGKIYK